jgi:DNA-binding NtrC family response regulator
MTENKRSILIIDDNPSILRTMTRVLGREGYDLYTAQTGKEASEKLSTKKFDVALIDVGLGETLGTDLLPLMNKEAPNMLKIVFTGTPMSEGTRDEVNRGADVFLLKPVKPETLIGILEEKLKGKTSTVSTH